MSAEPTVRRLHRRTGRQGPRTAGPGPPALPPRPPTSKIGFAPVSHRYVTWLVIMDTLLAVAFFALVGEACQAWFPDLLPRTWAGLPGLAWPVFVASHGGYRRSRIGIGTNELRAVLRSGLWLPVLAAYPAAVARDEGWLLLVVASAPPFVAASLVVRLVARRRLHALQRRGIGARRTLLVGPEDAVASLQAHLAAEPHCGMVVQGVCLPLESPGAASRLGVPVLGGLGDVRTVVDEGGFEAVAVTGGACMEEFYLRHLAWSLEGTDAELLISPRLAEIVRPRLDIRPLVGVPLLHVQMPRFDGWQRVIKRGLDVVLTTVGLVLLAPLLAVVALAIRLEDGGPVLFRQTRIGRDGRPFTMLKFRSMVVDAEDRKAALLSLNEGHGALFKIAHDPRVTRVGRVLRRWSIDELPQLLNVLAGSMSLVGPRPHLAGEVAAMPPDASRRALVTPGVTGLWQINGRSDLSGEDGLRLDLRYVETWSIALDLHILWKTVWAVLRRTGAC